MSQLEAIVAITIDDRPTSLRDVLRSWKIAGRLEGLLRQVVEEKLIADAAQRENVSISDAELQAGADAFRQTHGLHLAEKTHAWLRAHRLTVEDFQERIQAGLLRRKLAEHLVGGQIERYFAENRTQFDRARLSQIVVDREGVAQELLTQLIEDGADFAVLARKHSRDAETRQAGGFLGVLDRRKLSPAVEAAVFGARPGDTVGPFKTPHGWHLIRVEELLPAQLDEQTAGVIRERLFQDWLQHRLTQARVHMPLLDLL